MLVVPFASIKESCGEDVNWGCSSVGRAPDLHSGGLGFNSPQLHIFYIITTHHQQASGWWMKISKQDHIYWLP